MRNGSKIAEFMSDIQSATTRKGRPYLFFYSLGGVVWGGGFGVSKN
jgi:hypothetical protein